MWDSKPKKTTSATLGLEAKIAPTIKGHKNLLYDLESKKKNITFAIKCKEISINEEK